MVELKDEDLEKITGGMPEADIFVIKTILEDLKKLNPTNPK